MKAEHFNGGKVGGEKPDGCSIDWPKDRHVDHLLVVIEHLSQKDAHLDGYEETLTPRTARMNGGEKCKLAPLYTHNYSMSNPVSQVREL